MKRASGKSNLSIVKDYVEGVRPFTQISVAESYDLKKRKEGEEWEDASGAKWKKVNGKKVGIDNIKTKVLDAVKDIHVCKICKCDTRFSSRKSQYLDHKVIFKTGKCYDCFIEFETHLKSKGIYESYCRKRDLKYLKGYLTDFKTKLEDTIAWCNTDDARKIQTLNDTGPDSVELVIENDDTDRVDVIKKDALKDLELVNARLNDIQAELSDFKLNESDVDGIEEMMISKYKNGRNTPDFHIKMKKS
jgi:hypothetical protein